MRTPFVIVHRLLGSDPVHFLPSANVVLVLPREEAACSVRFVLPHRTVDVLEGVAACVSLSPNFVKCLIGETRRHLGRTLLAADHAILAPFVPVRTVMEASALLVDLRSSLEVTPDEAEFIDLWAQHQASVGLPTGDRRIQRLCLRYAGQAPTAINATTRLARTLEADNVSGLYNGLGEYADASHFARACRSATGRTPAAWRNMSQTFY